jgi:hypothetical protein
MTVTKIRTGVSAVKQLLVSDKESLMQIVFKRSDAGRRLL